MSGRFNNMWEKEESWQTNTPYQPQFQQYSFSNNPNSQQQQFETNYGQYHQQSTSDMIVDAEELAFQQGDYTQQYNQQNQAKMSFFYDQPPSSIYQPPSQQQSQQSNFKSPYDYEDEPPLMEELGIFPDLIMRKVKIVLDPFSQVEVQEDYDLGGPLIFCLCFGLMTFLSGAKVNFGYVYGISVSSCIFMYLLLKMMWEENTHPSFMTVASVLGYSLLPVVFLSTIGIFFKLANFFGYCISLFAVGWASWAASRGFSTISQDDSQRILVAYPCAILYGVFTLMVVF